MPQVSLMLQRILVVVHLNVVHPIGRPSSIFDFGFCSWTGVILDPVYSGKAFYAFLKSMQANPGDWKGRKVLFLHTGGLLGMYSEAAELQAMLEKQGRAHRLDATTISAQTHDS